MHLTDTTQVAATTSRLRDFTPIYDRNLGLVHVPLMSLPGFAVMEIEDFDVLRQRCDLVMSPLLLGRHFGRPSVRARYVQPGADGKAASIPVCDLLVRPPIGHRAICMDGNPMNFRRGNLRAVRADLVPGWLPDDE
nr:hypothetical protein [Variovorax boronicumulans]